VRRCKPAYNEAFVIEPPNQPLNVSSDEAAYSKAE
jgi:hypothetical protein